MKKASIKYILIVGIVWETATLTYVLIQYQLLTFERITVLLLFPVIVLLSALAFITSPDRGISYIHLWGVPVFPFFPTRFYYAVAVVMGTLFYLLVLIDA